MMVRGAVIRDWCKWLWGQVLDLVYPPFCLLCDQVLDHGTEAILCDQCQGDYPVHERDLCVICSKPLQDKTRERCMDCRKRVHFFEQGKALWVYEGQVKEAILAYKYKNRRELAELFAKGLGRYYNEHIKWHVDCVVPVPLHRSRLKERGFSQTALLVRYFSKETGVPGLYDGLVRTIPTMAQEGLSDKERLINVRHAFGAREDRIRGKDILLIDDVYTTGATLDGCAKALIDAGAGQIYFMTLAIGRGY